MDHALYWETAGATKTFTHPLRADWRATVSPDSRVLDYGCGYGRLTAELADHGFEQTLGVDILAPGGLLYVSDLVRQSDERNRRRYDARGVFTTDDGAVCRHHEVGHLRALMRDFDLEAERPIQVTTMNGNPLAGVQLLARRR
jgi:SAM-dependent methyltransferase